MHVFIRKMFVFLSVVLFGFSVSASGISEKQTLSGTTETKKPMIMVSILPQQYFVEQIAGDLVDHVVLVGEGQSPHTYEPTPNQMAQLAQADVWILSGTDFEIALEPKIRSLYPKLLVIDGTDGVTFRSLENHSHEGEEDHDHADEIGIDRHTWLGKDAALVMSKHIKEALISLLPLDNEVIESNYQNLVSAVETEFSNLEELLLPLQGRTVFVYHPAFGYFLDEFGIVQEAVETGGKEPTAKTLSALIEMAKEDNAAAVFVQKQFPVATATTVAQAIGAQVIGLDPLASNWLENIRIMGEALVSALN